MPASLTADQRAFIRTADRTAILSLLRQHAIPYSESRVGEHMLLPCFERALVDGRIPLSVLETLPLAPVRTRVADMRELGFSPEQAHVLGSLPRDPAVHIAGAVMSVKREALFEFVAENGRLPRVDSDEALALANR